MDSGLGHSHKTTTISVRGDTYDRLEAEADRLGMPVAQLVESLIGDPVTWQATADRIHMAATISVRSDAYDRLEAEADRIGIPVAQLVEGLIGDPVTWQATADRIRKAA